MSTHLYIFRGRDFNEEEIRLIKEIVDKHFLEGRKAIARRISQSNSTDINQTEDRRLSPLLRH